VHTERIMTGIWRSLLQVVRSFEHQLVAPLPAIPDIAARVRAHKLLTTNLTPAQRHQLATTDSFEVVGGDTGTRYRLHYRRTLNIERLSPNGQVEGLLCVVPKGALPTGDQLLAQKIALELFETAALRVANAGPAFAWIPDSTAY
jgi:hypothetical protein